MEKEQISLIESDKDKVLMPSVNNDTALEQKSMISMDINNAINKDTVKQLILPEISSIANENFIFDFSDCESISVFQKEALKSLIDSEGNVALYLYRKNGLVEFGKGEKYSLERLVPLIKHYVFNNEIQVYKNYHIGDTEVNPVVDTDFTKLRLRL